jgi:aminopeptidase-like protein
MLVTVWGCQEGAFALTQSKAEVIIDANKRDISLKFLSYIAKENTKIIKICTTTIRLTNCRFSPGNFRLFSMIAGCRAFLGNYRLF